MVLDAFGLDEYEEEREKKERSRERVFFFFFLFLLCARKKTTHKMSTEKKILSLSLHD